MNITPTEKLMYEVMKAVYESGIPVSFKGSMVLKAFLLEKGYDEDTRHTVDIDANWYSETAPSAEQMSESLQNAISKTDSNLEGSLYRMYGEGRSAGFKVRDKNTSEVLFTIDIDVNRPVYSTRIYEVDDLHFCGAVPAQMIADKAVQKGVQMILTADHGNAECMEDAVTHAPYTAHTTNPVPLYVINAGNIKLKDTGALCDIAPTVLELSGIEKPAEMTGNSLIKH